MKKIDSVSIGDRFNRLTIIDKINTEYVRCKCDCGNIKDIRVYSLLDGSSQSCGCLQREKASKVGYKTLFKHGKTKTRLFKEWASMRQRCHNIADKKYKYYGGKGIKVCNEWSKFISFEKWALSNGYNDNLTIDRINFNGDYCPKNCRWVDMTVQNNNKSNNILIEIDGKTKTLSQWCKTYDFDYKLAWGRYSRGKRGKEIFNRNFVHPKLITHNGKTYNMKHWAKILGINPTTFRNRVVNNWPENRMFKEINI